MRLDLLVEKIFVIRMLVAWKEKVFRKVPSRVYWLLTGTVLERLFIQLVFGKVCEEIEGGKTNWMGGGLG